MTCVMNNSVRIPFRSYFELGATQVLFSETVNVTHTTLKKHKDSSWNVLWHHYGKWLSILLQRTMCSKLQLQCIAQREKYHAFIMPLHKCTRFFWGTFYLTKLHFWTYRHIFFIFWLICSLCLVEGIGEQNGGLTSHLWFFMWMFYVCGWCEGTKSTRCKSNHCKIVLLKYKSGNSHTGSEFT